MRHFNYIGQNEYQGNNITVLDGEGYKTGLWVTFLQVREMGLSIKKGEHGMKVFRGFQEDDEGQKKYLGYKTVFNIEQTNCPQDQYEHDYKLFVANNPVDTAKDNKVLVCKIA